MALPRTLLHTLQRLHHPLRFAELERLLRNQQLDRETIQREQQQAITALVQHAVQHSPYYANRFSNLEWDHQLSRLPILRKQDVLEQREQMLDRSANRSTIQTGYTGGSTGTPLAYYYDQQKLELMRAGQYRSFMQCGWRPGERVLQLWGASQDLNKPPSLRSRWLQQIAAERTIGAFQFDESELLHWSQQIRDYRPVVIRGYPSILAQLARYTMDQQIELPDSIRGCFSTAEVLYPWQRELIEAALRCKVYNQYGSREVPNISCECSHGRQHLFSDLVALESVEIEGQNQLLVTSLTNRLMPFIRYQIGDTGRLLDERCECGSPFPLMEMEVCRSNDLLRAPNGLRIYPSWLIHLLDGVEEVEQYQFRQTAIDQITLHIVSHSPLPETLHPRLQQQLQQKMGESMQLSLQRCPSIPRSASGKHRFVCCDLD